jgi:hypothetical protein
MTQSQDHEDGIPGIERKGIISMHTLSNIYTTPLSILLKL